MCPDFINSIKKIISAFYIDESSSNRLTFCSEYLRDKV